MISVGEEGLWTNIGGPEEIIANLKSLSQTISKSTVIRIPKDRFVFFDTRDPDKDGLVTIYEEFIGTNPKKRDSDVDRHDDGTEVNNGFSPLSKKQVKIKQLRSLQKLSGKILKVKG